MADEESNETVNQTVDEKVTDEQQRALIQAFDDIDIDNTGTISRKELRVALQLVGQNPTEEEMEKHMVGSTEGEFSKDQYKTFINDHFKIKTQEEINLELIDAFSKFDDDMDGFISKKEFRKVMTQLGNERLTETEADDLLDRLDTQEVDGKLNVVELGKLFLGD